MCYFPTITTHRSCQWIFSVCSHRAADLFFQKSSSVCGVGFLPSSRASEESFFRTARIWWLHSITTDSKEWMMLLSTVSPLWSFTSEPFFNVDIGQMMHWHMFMSQVFVYLLSVSRAACSTLSEPAGRGSRVLPWTWPDTTNTLVLREWTWRLTSWDTTCGHSVWFLLLDSSGATTWRSVKIYFKMENWLLWSKLLVHTVVEEEGRS